ncbi:adenosylcobinamide amidohydrolase [Aneurinibacillus terranovensis]|uniref:adenosylcobinamide amidohydrolase n=1 Tax=Aneurinibacillus terranovensis TaxID=278991 RepID=UPI003CCC3CAE
MSTYHSLIWPEVTMTHKDNHLLLQTQQPLTVVSSALWGGGISQATHFVNWHVPLDYSAENPVEQMRGHLTGWGYPVSQTVGLQTAASLTSGSVHEENGDQFRIICMATAGTGNSARAGRLRQTFSAYQCGTINIFVLLDARLTPAAMVNGIITATEAKAAALQDLGIRDEHGEIATGTTTDSIVIGCSQNPEYASHLFAGVATTVGNSIGRLVYEAVCEAAAVEKEE